MRLWICSLSILVLASCNINFPADSSAALPGRITKAQVLQYLPGIRLGRTQTVKTISSQRKSFRIKADLITHNRFLFLEFAPEKKGKLHNYKDITAEFDTTGVTGTKFYDVTHSSLALKYENFSGRTVAVKNNDRTQITSKISGLVLVNDPVYEIPYLAAVLKNPENSWFNNSWATTNKRLNPYPFTSIQNDELSQMALVYFDSLSEYKLIKEQCNLEADADNYEEIQVQIFEFRKTEKYVLVRYNFIGVCNSIEENYTALYHVTPGNWVREAEGSINLHFQDLIDTDGDLYPELLMNDLTKTVIYEINYKGFSEIRSIQWSSFVCPC